MSYFSGRIYPGNLCCRGGRDHQEGHHGHQTPIDERTSRITLIDQLHVRIPHKTLLLDICKMHGFSTVDGFVEISDCMAEMIKYVANEPSVGLFFIQKHTQNAVPNVIKLKNNVTDKSHETTLHTQDLEDSVTMVRSMKECGFPIANEMIKDINKSLVTITAKNPKRGLINRSTSNVRTEKTSFWGNSAVYGKEGNEKKGTYFSSVFKFSKQKSPFSVTSASTTSSQGMEDESQPDEDDTSDIGSKLMSLSEKYDDFKASKEAKLEEWLEGTSNHDDNCSRGDENRL